MGKLVDLHDSYGKHIANFLDGQLYNTNGYNIGHYLAKEKIFIDMNGRYLGEIVDGNRLLYNDCSLNKTIMFGVYGDYGFIGNYGNYGNIGALLFPGYSDVRI